METLDSIKGLGPKNIKLLNKLGIYDMKSLIEFYPFRYDILKRSDINTLNDKELIVIDGYVESIPNVFYINKKLDKMTFKINIGLTILSVIIFNRGFLKSKIGIKEKITIIGKYDKLHNSVTASDIRFGLLETDKIEPVYHTTYGINGKQISKYIDNALQQKIRIKDYIPDYLKEKYKFRNKEQDIYEIHKPNNQNNLKKSLNRIKYEELFLFMLKMNYLKNNKNIKIGLKRNVGFEKIEDFINKLPFQLTQDQYKSVKEIYDNLIDEKRMNRLLQGDVGSGKTIVSIISMYINYLSGYQSALMAPTEILATQHYNNIKKLFEGYDIKVALLTGKLKAKEKKEIYDKIKNNEIDFIIGTHALISKDVIYNNLGLVITDEQHRFGVNQRGNLKNKGLTPDILYMSATPIPRTYALTLYGDMDISNIKTIPTGKKEIITTIKKNSEIKDVLSSMYEQLKLNHQIYVIAPLIEESDKIDLENVTTLSDKINKAFGKYYKIGILHGKLSNQEKEEVMNKFQKNEINILISTTVVEVGVDVKNATMIVIFDAFRYGLSSLHQLRGRVGRNDLQSYCILISNNETERLKILTETNDGFKISEEDFLIRGSGDLFGSKQSGDMVFRVADFKKDYKILLKAKEDSEEFLNNDLINSNVLIKELLFNNQELN
ncbi:MAG: ATP-dependent DNA helicase RecG [Bacilli bacterium]|nr:ATP-dependent DNA helicase RecG [Bacilli bacterium]